MSEPESVALAPPIAARLASAGWPAAHPAVQSAALVAARGNNLVLSAPPSPAWAAPALGGLLSRLAAGKPGPAVLLCPAETIDEWGRLAAWLAADTDLRIAAAHTPGRITRLLRSGAADLAVLSPENAEELIRRAALKMEAAAAVLLAWPDRWAGEDLAASLLADLPGDAQRILVTDDPRSSAALVERHVWRAPVSDLLGEAPAADAPAVRSAPVAWRRRIEALVDLVEQLDPPAVAVWTADTRDHDAIRSALASTGTGAAVTTGDAPAAALVLAFDPPTPAVLRQLASAGETVLLLPPGTERYMDRIAPRRRPVLLRGVLDRARGELEQARREVTAALDAGPEPAALDAIAPLLERFEGPLVAAALWRLWRSRPAETRPGAGPPPGGPGSARLWIGAGTRDEVTTGDVVGVLARHAEVPRDRIGKIEIRESFTLVELAAGIDAEAVAERVTGRSIGRRRLVAKVDRGRPAARPRTGMPPRRSR